jgi:hypothetical protein
VEWDTSAAVAMSRIESRLGLLHTLAVRVVFKNRPWGALSSVARDEQPRSNLRPRWYASQARGAGECADADRCLRRAGIELLHTVALGFLLLKTIEQAIAGKPLAGALGKPGDRALILVGHDTNIANMAGMLGLSWLLPGYQRDDTPPGGALVFELWRASATGDHTVRTYYMAQTLEQMRKALPVTLDAPPGKAAVFVPACSTAGEGFPCAWKAFQRALEAAIDPAFVRP